MKNNNNNYFNKIESVSGTIYSLIKDNELEKAGIITNSKNTIINVYSNSFTLIGEGVISILQIIFS